MATERQKKAVKLIVENGGIVSKAMEEAGYTKATAKTPQKLTESKGYREAAKPVVHELKKAIKRSIKKQKECINTASFNDHTTLVGKYQSLVELLEGKPTERVEHNDYKSLTTEELLQLKNESNRPRTD